MQLTDVRIDRFDALRSFSVENISPRITVFYGPNGSGKTTFVQFLRGLLFGYRRSSSLPGSDFSTESGMVRIQTPKGLRALHRSWTTTGTEKLTVTDQYDRLTELNHESHLPAWVSEDVFYEVYSAGPEEVDHFDLLTRLCIECGSARGTSEAELRQAEAALLQTVRDRDGNGIQGGVVHRISELRRRQGELQGEIALLRKPAADLPNRIELLIREIDGLTATITRNEQRIREIDAEIPRLEQLLIELRGRNVLPLNRPRLEEEIRLVTVRLDRWREIRASLVREADTHRLASDAAFRGEDSLRSIRAIVARLEERAQLLTDRLQNASLPELERTREIDLLRQIRGEVAALCQYMTQHERSTVRHTESMYAALTDRSLADATQMERMLEEQLATLRMELGRADNILTEAAVPAHSGDCRFVGHSETLRSSLLNTGVYQNAAQVEAQIETLRREGARLFAELPGLEEGRASRRSQLERLRLELAGASSLEQLDGLRGQIAELDAEIGLLEDQRRQLDRTEISLREVLDRLKSRTVSRVFELASHYAARLTEGECRVISGTLPDRLSIQTIHHADPQILSQLSRGTRGQIGLALRLALIQIRSETQGHVPLILDDVFITSDDSRSVAAVQLLSEIAQTGQQILFFTPQSNVRDLFARFHADVRTFETKRELPAPVVAVPVALHAYVEPRVEIPVAPPAPEPIVYLQPAAPVPQSSPATPTNWLFYLEVDHGVEDLAGITLGELEALRTAGIITIDDLLVRTVPQIEEATRQKGFLLSVDRLHALRGQAEMTIRVPMLRRSDAALLFAAGIETVEELSRLRPETVYDRVCEFQRSEAGSRFRRGGRLIDRQQSINWARFGQFTRSLDDARHSRSHFSMRQTPRINPTVPAAAAVGSLSKSVGVVEADPQKIRRRRRVAEDLTADDRRARRLARRRKQASRLRTEPAAAVSEETAPVERIGGMRFFLNRTSEVEKAPSIGPRTAQMLEAIGVRTVDDFLSMAPDRLAEKLNHRRITAAVIQQWQAQSRLMCQIPELRGHDAQILVACHIVTPEALATQKPADLLAIVDPFCRTKEGERIIRSGRKPDLAEVTEWIQWAANARSMRAA